MKVVYEQTGEYRPPKKGEWFLGIRQTPLEAEYDFPNDSCWILCRREIEEGEDGDSRD